MIIVANKHRTDLKSDWNVRTFFVVDMLIIIDFILIISVIIFWYSFSINFLINLSQNSNSL